MGRSEPGGQKERQLARSATKVFAAGRKGDTELVTGDRLTKRDQIGPEQAYLYTKRV